MKKLSLLAVVAVVLLGLAAHADEKSSDLSFLVVKEDSGKPVRNANVILHEVDKDGHQSRGGLELKTNAEGRVSISGINYGKMRVQVLAPGFQTFGDDFEINRPKQEITVKLKRPQKQYSIYDSNPKK